MRITVGHAERCTQRTGNTVIGISQAASPKAFPLQQMKKIVVMNAIVAGQRDIVVPRNTLPELEASHHDRIIQDFHMIDPGKRQLLRQRPNVSPPIAFKNGKAVFPPIRTRP